MWKLFEGDALILRQAKAMFPVSVWIVIAGSPCQGLTFAGYLNDMLGRTGNRSMLFFAVYLVIYYLQSLYGTEKIRFLLENAGSMQPIQDRRGSFSGDEQLKELPDFLLFLTTLNSFHPSLIDAALGSDEGFQRWVAGKHDGQPGNKPVPSITDIHESYQKLFRMVLEQGHIRKVKLTADRVAEAEA